MKGGRQVTRIRQRESDTRERSLPRQRGDSQLSTLNSHFPSPLFLLRRGRRIGATGVARGGRAEDVRRRAAVGAAVWSYLKFHFVSSRLPLDLAEMKTVVSGLASFCVIWERSRFSRRRRIFTGTGAKAADAHLDAARIDFAEGGEVRLMSGWGCRSFPHPYGW